MANRIFRLEWESCNKDGDKFRLSGYFIKILNKYFPIFTEGTFFSKEDNNVISEKEVELNILGQFKDVK